MALIKDAQAATMARDAIVLDLGDLYRQGEEIRDKADTEARRIVDAASLEADKIIEDAMARGFEEGRAAGAEQGRAAGFEAGRNEAFEEQFTRLQGLINGWTAALDVFLESRDTLVRDARQDVLQLAVRIAERVLKRELVADTGAAVRQLEDALAIVLNPTRLCVEVNTADRTAVSEALPGLLSAFSKSPNAEVVVREDVEPGGCVVRTDCGTIDARIGSQLDRLVEQLVPAGDSPRWKVEEPAADGAPPTVSGPEAEAESEPDA